MESAQEQLDNALAMLERLNDGESLESFILRISPLLPPPSHVRTIMDLFERSRHEEVRAVVSMPPGHAKSITACHGMAWRMIRDPGCKHAFVSYGDDLAFEKSRTVRKMVREAGIELSKEASAVSNWENTTGGALFAAGIQGSITGKRISGVAVVDDPIKSRRDADSENIRNAVYDGFNANVMTRLMPGASVIVIATRWHPDDLIGRLAQSDAWEVVNLPAISEEDGTPADEFIENTRDLREDVHALWPEMFSVDMLSRQHRQIGEFDWASLYQGQPRPKGSTVFRPDPSRFRLSDFKLDGHRIVISVDPAATASTRADFSVATAMCMDGHGSESETWVLDRLKIQVTIPVLVRRLLEMQEKWQCPIACEAVGAFKAVPDLLREADPRLVIIPVQLKGDKFARAQPYAAAWNDGRVYVPIDADWGGDFLDEHANFTGAGDVHDDQVDAGAHGFTALSRAPRPRRSINTDFLPYG